MTSFYSTDICRFNADASRLILLDQTLLPGEERYIEVQTAEEVCEAIAFLRVRGAPLIGIAAAMGLCVALKQAGSAASFTTLKQTIESARPTAVNLTWALARMEQCRHRCYLQQGWAADSLLTAEDFLYLLQQLQAEALAIKAEEAAACSAIGQQGSALITPHMGILTHCNAGHLATGSYGTALAPIYYALQQGKAPRVYADETRPLLQGARLTMYELCHSGVDATLLCDNMVASVMSSGRIQLVLVGSDRVARNGDAANKIGTYGVAVLARHFGIPFYICAPKSTFDKDTPTGKEIQVEHRSSLEVTTLHYSAPMAPAGCKVENSAFDVTPHELITGYITEHGILTPENLSAIFL